jgi:hypothetical protein
MSVGSAARTTGIAFSAALSLVWAVPSQAAGRAAKSAQQLDAYVKIWGRDSGVSAANVQRYYAPQVTYYGKRMSRGQVYRDKLRFIRAWPYRSYRIAPGTFSSGCGRAHVCSARGVLVWEWKSSARRRINGASRLGLTYSDGQIIKETAIPLRR